MVISVSGVNTTEIATVGLGQATGKEMIIAGNIFAFLAMATSFLTLGLALKGVYHYDFKIKHITAWLLAITFPLIIYAMGLTNFIQIISLAGALGFGVNGVIYIFTYWAARKKGKRKPEYTLSKTFALPVSVLLIAVFIFGLFYTISNY
ncbi:MAG TPA: hypothetical protein ENI70_00405 [Candidatus Peregrinibacteria bacterium]|nr:hypothetical protein [Candidatus Peregrinibacteria bacterium]